MILAALIIVRAYCRDEYTLNNIAIVTARVSSAKVVSIHLGAWEYRVPKQCEAVWREDDKFRHLQVNTPTGT